MHKLILFLLVGTSSLLGNSTKSLTFDRPFTNFENSKNIFEVRKEERVDVAEDEALISHLKSKITAYVYSDIAGKSTILLDGRLLDEGASVSVSMGEKRTVDLRLKAVAPQGVTFVRGEHEIFIPHKKHSAISNSVTLARGILLTPDGWAIAEIGNLNENSKIQAWLGKFNYSAEVMEILPDQGIAILKLCNSSNDFSFPYLPLAEKKPEIGDTVLAQQAFKNEILLKQLVLENEEKQPKIAKNSATVLLNEKHEILSFFSENREVSASEILPHIKAKNLVRNSTNPKEADIEIALR